MLSFIADPLITACVLVLILIWSIVGAAADVHLRTMTKPWLASAALVLAGGPIVWFFRAYSLLAGLRVRILSHYGVRGYSCCGDHQHRHKRGCIADHLSNHPAGRL